MSGGCITDRINQGDWQPEPNTNLHDPGYPQSDNHPVVCVSWNDAQAFIAWLNAQTNGVYRLLSESEWEYIARAGSTTVYPWGDDPASGCGDANTADATMLDKYSDHPDKYPADKYPGFTLATCRDGALKTAPVGSYRANAFGLYDVIGNVGDWVQDCATMNYDTLPADGEPNASGDCTRHMTRGGSWGTMVKDYRSARQISRRPGFVHPCTGRLDLSGVFGNESRQDVPANVEFPGPDHFLQLLRRRVGGRTEATEKLLASCPSPPTQGDDFPVAGLDLLLPL